jgi:outer membrane protein TolC
MLDRARRLAFVSGSLLLCLAPAAVAFAAQAGLDHPPARLTDVTVSVDGQSTRVDITVTAAVTYRVVPTGQADRLTLEFENTTYAWRDTPMRVTSDLVVEVRGSQYLSGIARVVIQVSRPVDYVVRASTEGLAVVLSPARSAEPSTPPPTPGDVATRLLDRAPPAESPGVLDIERLKQTLAQVPPPGGGETPSPSGRGPGGAPSLGRRGQQVALTLRQTIELAARRNYDLRRSALSVQSAEVEVPKQKARFHPSVGFALTISGMTTVPQGSSETTQVTGRLTPLVTEALPTGGTVVLSSDVSRDELHPANPATQFTSSVVLSVVQPLLRGGRIYVATQPIRNAEFDARVAQYTLSAQTLQLAARATSAYYAVLLADQVVGVTQAAIERDRALVDASQALFQARIVTKRDVYSAELSLAQDSARLVSNQADLEAAKNALADVVGLPIDTDIVLLDKEVPFEPLRVDEDTLIARAVKQRPEIAAVQEQLAKSELNIRVARNALLAQLDLVASYGRANTRTSFSRSLELSGDVWSAGLVFSFPIGNVAAKATLTQAEIERSQLLLSLEQARRQVELDVRAAVIKLQRSVERIRALTVAIEQAKGKLEVGKAQFSLGQATNLDITDAQQAILNAETDLLTAIVDYNVGLAELEASVGGPIRSP